jgi:hypothetical protein|nr:MAG TPA: hypothetical protein [Crassvirales sp.]
MTQEEKELRIKELEASKTKTENFIEVAKQAEELADATMDFFMKMHQAVINKEDPAATARVFSEGMTGITALAMSTKLSSSMAVKLEEIQLDIIDAQLKNLGVGVMMDARDLKKDKNPTAN